MYHICSAAQLVFHWHSGCHLFFKYQLMSQLFSQGNCHTKMSNIYVGGRNIKKNFFFHSYVQLDSAPDHHSPIV